MKKRLIFLIFFIALCFFVKVDVFNAYGTQLGNVDCTYKTNDGKNQIWVHFAKNKETSKWEIRLQENGKQDIGYEDKVLGKKSLSEYKVTGFNEDSMDTCPKSLDLQVDKKVIRLFDDEIFFNDITNIHACDEIGPYPEEKSVCKKIACEYTNKLRIGKSKEYKYYVRFKTYSNSEGSEYFEQSEYGGPVKKFFYSETYTYDADTNKRGISGISVTSQPIVSETKIVYPNVAVNLLCPYNLILSKSDSLRQSNSSVWFLNSNEENDRGKTCIYGYNNAKYIVSYFKVLDTENDSGIRLFYENNTLREYESELDFYLPEIKEGDNCPIALEIKEDQVTFAKSIYFTNTRRTEASDYCYQRTDEESCENPNGDYACVWVEDEYGGFCNTNELKYVACADAYDIPSFLPDIISFLVNFLKIVTPIILIVVGIISLLKALAASNEDEIKKAQKSLIRKMIAATLVFFIISIVQFVIMKIADDGESGNIDDCMTCFLNNQCKHTAYYKSIISGESVCHYLNGELMDKCPDGK